MNNKSSIHLSTKIFLCIFFLTVSCSTRRSATSPHVTLIPVNGTSQQSENYEVRVDYTGLRNSNYEFELNIRNKTGDSVFVNPDTFRYSYIPENKKQDKIFVQSINPEERIEQLKIEKDKLKNEKNPYSLADKSVKEIVTEGIVQGAVAAVFGQDAKELEKQREEDERDWEQKHNLKLEEINKELDFWNNNSLLPGIIPPKNVITGKVLFPTNLDTKALKIEVPLQGIVHEFKFEQSD